MLCVAAAALVFCLMGGAHARTHVYARVKCVGLYCQIVTLSGARSAPRRPAERRVNGRGARAVMGSLFGRKRKATPHPSVVSRTE